MNNTPVPPAPATPATPCPGSNMALAIISTILCFLPTGIVAIVYASKVKALYFSGKTAEAAGAAKSAMIWSVVSIVLGILLNLAFFMISYFVVVEKIQQQQELTPDYPAEVYPDINY